MSKLVFALLIVFISSHRVFGKIFAKCELAKELFEVYNATEESVLTMICTAQHSSNFDTSYRKEDSYGIFNVTCDDSKKSDRRCNVSCSLLVDDNIEDDFECAYKNSKDFRLNESCENINKSLLTDCNINISSESDDSDDVESVIKDIITAYEIPTYEVEIIESNVLDWDDLNQKVKNQQPESPRQNSYPGARPTTLENLEKIQIMHNLIQQKPHINAQYIFLFV